MEDRIIVNRNKKYKVNKKLAEEIDDKGKNNANTVLSDDRFSKLFNDKNFEIDYTSDMYKPVRLYFIFFNIK